MAFPFAVRKCLYSRYATPARIRQPNTTATATPAAGTVLPVSCFTCGLPAALDERPWIGFAGAADVEEVRDEDGDGVWDVDWSVVADTEEEVADCVVEPLVASEFVAEELVWLEEVVAEAVGTTVTTCGLAVDVLSFCVAGVCEVVGVAAAVCSVLWVVVIPRMLSARLSIGDKMSRA